MRKGFIGVVHVPPMPGDPQYRSGGFREVERSAMRDAEALVAGGVDGIIIENFGSAPFSKGTQSSPIPPHQIALLTLLTRACIDRFDVKVGVNCLRNDIFSALGIAAATGADMVRVNIHVGAYVTDQGLIEGEAHASLRYRQLLEASQNIRIMADVLVKHATPLAPLTPENATKDCLDRGMADAVIVTGDGTGQPVDPALLKRVRDAAKERPLFIGSGMTPEMAPHIAPFADGAIVGTWLKEGGILSAPVDPARVAKMAALLRKHLSPPR